MLLVKSAPAGIAGWGGSRYTETSECRLDQPKEGRL